MADEIVAIAHILLLTVVAVLCASCGEMLSDPVIIRVDNVSYVVDGQAFTALGEIDTTVVSRGVSVHLDAHICTDRARLIALLDHLQRLAAENKNTGIYTLGNMIEIGQFGNNNDEQCSDAAT